MVVGANVTFPLNKSLNVNAYKLSAIVAICYCLASSPFVTSSLLPVYLRAMIELSALFLLFYFLTKLSLSKGHLYFGILSIVIVLSRSILDENLLSGVSFINKTLFFVFIFNICTRRPICLSLLQRFWIKFWIIGSLSVIGIFITRHFSLLPYSPISFSEFSAKADYNYYGSFLGFYVPYNFFGFQVPKINWIFYEPVFLSLFLSFNMVNSKRFFASRLASSTFALLNFTAGMLTFTTSFFIFAILIFIYFLFNFSGRKAGFAIMFVSMCFISLYLFQKGEQLIAFSSLADRLVRLEIFFRILSDASLIKLLFGHGIDYIPKWTDRSVGVGYLVLIVDLGAVFTFLYLCTLYGALKSNQLTLFTFAFYGLLFNPSSFPLFYLAIVLSSYNLTKSYRGFG